MQGEETEQIGRQLSFLTGTQSRIFFWIPGAGVTPAQGSVKPTAGFTFNEVNSVLPQLDRAWREYPFHLGDEGVRWGYAVAVAEQHHCLAAVVEAEMEVGH